MISFLIFCIDHNVKSSSVMKDIRIHENAYCQVNDLIHLPGPLTEDALLRSLQSRFYAKQYYVSQLNFFKIQLIDIINEN